MILIYFGSNESARVRHLPRRRKPVLRRRELMAPAQPHRKPGNIHPAFRQKSSVLLCFSCGIAVYVHLSQVLVSSCSVVYAHSKKPERIRGRAKLAQKTRKTKKKNQDCSRRQQSEKTKFSWPHRSNYPKHKIRRDTRGTLHTSDITP